MASFMRLLQIAIDFILKFNITTKYLLRAKKLREQNQSAQYGVMEPEAGGRPVR